MRILLAILLLFGLFFGFNSCSGFDELNTDPDKTSEVSAEMLATNLILQTVSYPSIGKGFLYKDMLAKYISYMEGETGYQYNKLERTEFYSLIKLANVEKMIVASKGSVYENSYTALGKFIRAYTFFNLTLSVGDIPYTEAIQGEAGIYNPKYDSQKEVFIGILNELEEASLLFGEGRDFAGDPIYKGKVSKWQKACNSLSLKVLSHMWKKTTDADLNVKGRFDEIVRAGNLFQSNEDNFQLVYSDLEVEYYPFYNSNFRNYPIMSITIVDKMKVLGDYRLFYFAEPSVEQAAAGKLPNEWDAYIGVDPSDDFISISAKYSDGAISGINQRYYQLKKGEPTFLLSYAEQCFIISEGIVRGWTAGDPQLYYQTGIRSAMHFTADNTPDDTLFHHNMKITDVTINDYLANADVAFTGSDDQKLQKIFQQRYFIGFMQDGWNSYYENRRTGFPKLPINELTNQNTIITEMPKRWLYPSKELFYNKTRVEEAITRQFGGNDDVNELMWILKDE